jgi:uncharacterized membrane protein HdeD (DUF308 family)
MDDSAFVIFISFGVLWTIMGTAAVIALLKADGQQIRLGKWGLVVAIPIILPLLAAFIFAATYHHSSPPV